MLWLPLGQRVFLVEHWMKIGAYLAPMILFYAVRENFLASKPLLSDRRMMASLLTSIYLVHQIEEHWVDLLGRVYPLHELLNAMLRDRIGESVYGVMTPEAIFFINTSLVWLPGFIAIWRAPDHLFPTLAMSGIILANGLAHLGQGLVTWSYNPGLLTAAVLFIPISLAIYGLLLKSCDVRPRQLVASIAWGIGAHALLFAGLLASGVYGIVPLGAYYMALVAWAILPAFMFNQTGGTTR